VTATVTTTVITMITTIEYTLFNKQSVFLSMLYSVAIAAS